MLTLCYGESLPKNPSHINYFYKQKFLFKNERTVPSFSAQLKRSSTVVDMTSLGKPPCHVCAPTLLLHPSINDRLVDGWLVASDLLYWCGVTLICLEVLVENREDLVIQDLVLADAVHETSDRLC